MAVGATIYKVDLNVIDIDRNYYQQHDLTLAQHPSETNERLMLRLLVFAMHADDLLRFTKGLSTDDEPDLWQKSLSDEIQLWVELGLPSEKRLKKASGRAQSVIVYTYGAGSAQQWWKQMQSPLSRFNNIQIFHIDESITNALSTYIQRNIEIQVTIQDAEIHVSLGENSLSFAPLQLR